MGTYLRDEPFTDHLTVTQRPDDTSLDAIQDLLLSCGAIVEPYTSKETGYRLSSKGGSGVVKVTSRAAYVSISASGQALAHLRAHRIFGEYLNRLSESPHKVTRLDATVDVMRDAPDALDELRASHPTGKINLSRKAIDTKLMLSIREDGRETGTFYAGHRSGTSARVTARVYDKQLERLERAQVETCPMTRYEITFGRDYGCTLADAANPKRLFYSHSDPLLSPPSEAVEPWVAHGSIFAYQPEKKVKRLPANALADLVQKSNDLETMLMLADASGKQGRKYLCRLLADRVLGKGSGVTLGE